MSAKTEFKVDKNKVKVGSAVDVARITQVLDQRGRIIRKWFTEDGKIQVLDKKITQVYVIYDSISPYNGYLVGVKVSEKGFIIPDLQEAYVNGKICRSAKLEIKPKDIVVYRHKVEETHTKKLLTDPIKVKVTEDSKVFKFAFNYHVRGDATIYAVIDGIVREYSKHVSYGDGHYVFNYRSSTVGAGEHTFQLCVKLHTVTSSCTLSNVSVE